ncbi:hypothetical protein [Streptomyces cupreus]|uniref:Uncharacterized protein n=1 Tax=Streptomyces cupreus TaxID=2759956 RepID=A0A7X1M9D7_9ACTN|nr:hypothetical protein [Streptomyces cupreus]MBC2903159.1 hypothetical protein [Streptomyces cupreus]
MSDVDCPHCHATLDNLDVRIVAPGPNGTYVAIKHTKDCVDYPPEPQLPDEEPTP